MNSILFNIRKRVDALAIDAAVASSLPMYIDFKNDYNNPSDDPVVIDVSTQSVKFLDGLKVLCDTASWPIEEGAFIWKIDYASKVFTLTNSYVRDDESTEGVLTSLADGTPLKVRFEIPVFGDVDFEEIDLWYNAAFNPTDVTALLRIGVTLTGDGGEFTIVNDLPLKVYFFKPTGITDVYVIDYPNINQIITV